MSWMEEDALATAILEDGSRGGTSRKRGMTDGEAEEEAMSDGEENEREALRCFIIMKSKRASRRQCGRCRGPCRTEEHHFGQVGTSEGVSWSKSRWDVLPDCTTSMFEEMRRIGEQQRLKKMPPLLQMDSGTDPGEGVTRAKLYCPVVDTFIRPDGTRCELQMGRRDKPTGCPGCGGEVSTTAEFGGPGRSPFGEG